MYRCKVCGENTPLRVPMFRLREYHMLKEPKADRMLRQIKREIPVCESCHKDNKGKEAFDF